VDGGRVVRAELEYRAGIDPGDEVVLVHDGGEPSRMWFTVDGAVRASAAWWPA
jgi:hypothetical protein